MTPLLRYSCSKGTITVWQKISRAAKGNLEPLDGFCLLFFTSLPLYFPRIACLSSPTLFQKLCQMKADPTVVLFEYDKRFDAYGEDFVFYDFNEPLSLPKHIAEHSFDLVVGDPPFLQDRCLGLFSQTMKFLAKGKMILCTGK